MKKKPYFERGATVITGPGKESSRDPLQKTEIVRRGNKEKKKTKSVLNGPEFRIKLGRDMRDQTLPNEDEPESNQKRQGSDGGLK